MLAVQRQPSPYQGFLENRWQSYENLSSPRANMAVASYKNELLPLVEKHLKASVHNQSFDIRTTAGLFARQNLQL